MFAKLKRRAREHMRGRPGHRFQDHYRRSRAARSTKGPLRRTLNLVVAILALAVALFLMIFPGPAVPFFLLAGILLAAESLQIARLMDWLEVKARAVFKWAKHHWDNLPGAARTTLKVLAPCFSILAAYLSWHLFHG